MIDDRDGREQGRPAGASLRNGPQRMRTRELLGRANELIIEHNGREYRLRVTSNGKLILTA